MTGCACVGPQGGAPLCPCRERDAEAHISRAQDSLLHPSAPGMGTIIGGPMWGWRAIDENTPRDGSHILACDASQSFGWMNGKPTPPVQTVVHWYEFGEDSGFYTSVNETEPQRTFPATHWKPLDGPADGASCASTTEPSNSPGTNP